MGGIWEAVFVGMQDETEFTKLTPHSIGAVLMLETEDGTMPDRNGEQFATQDSTCLPGG